MNTSSQRGTASFAALALFSLACTTTTTIETSSPPDDAGNLATKPESPEDSSPDAGETDADAGVPTISCGASTTHAACEQCCATLNPEGESSYSTISIAIMCRSENCQSDCASNYCASPPTNPDATCKQCWSSVTARNASEFFATCKADTACSAYSSCIGGCPSK